MSETLKFTHTFSNQVYIVLRQIPLLEARYSSHEAKDTEILFQERKQKVSKFRLGPG